VSGKIYTRGGDSGETSLANGDRIAKNSVRVTAYGNVDEANSQIGMVRATLEVAAAEEAELDRMLDFVQHRLFNCSSRLATPVGSETEHTPHVSDADVERLEGYIDSLTERTSELEHFVLPGGCELSARMHVARTVVRRAERAILDLTDRETIDPSVLAFINRLSDLLFAMARFANRMYQGGDVYWKPEYAE
jgi:cob(I)alamin adenosyltransferase